MLGKTFLRGLTGTVALLPAAALAQTAGPVNPTAQSVQESQLLEALRFGETVSGRVTIPAQDAAHLVKPGNRDWTAFNLGILDWVMIGALLLTTLAVLGFYLWRGRIGLDKGLSGRTITRFGLVERVMHWAMAFSFILLALTGLNVAFGRYVILPWLGEGAFGTLSQWGKLAHNFLAWPFLVCVALTFVLWVRHNIPSRLDIEWLKAGGGMLRNGRHPKARKFNAGQKIVFWAVVLGGTMAILSGLALMFPFLLGSPLQWQVAQVVHALAAAALIAVTIGHIYIATAGSEGALTAMTNGQVDLNWAEQHHPLWVEEEMQKGRAPRRESVVVAAAE